MFCSLLLVSGSASHKTRKIIILLYPDHTTYLYFLSHSHWSWCKFSESGDAPPICHSRMSQINSCDKFTRIVSSEALLLLSAVFTWHVRPLNGDNFIYSAPTTLSGRRKTYFREAWLKIIVKLLTVSCQSQATRGPLLRLNAHLFRVRLFFKWI